MFSFGSNRRRALKNGAGEIVKISTDARSRHEPEWWGDTYLLSYNLSRGDKSTAVGALQAEERGMNVSLTTAEDTVTDELWERLSHLGYFEAEQTPPELPESIHLRVITKKGRQPDMLYAFLMASQALLNGSNGKVQGVREFSKKFLTLNYRSLSLPVLEYLRATFFSNQQEVHAEPGEPLVGLCERLVRVRAFEKLDRSTWRPTEESTMIAPYILDTFIYEKS